ncbi:PMEI domain-containing protein, partial [Cephalotus follicularis]
CRVTIYRRLCYNSLSIYATQIESNPKLLVHTALNLTMTASQRTSKMMRKLAKNNILSPKEGVAMADCIEEISDSVDELNKSIGELGHINTSNFALTVSDIQTWVSAALTDDGTCMDGVTEVGMNIYLKNLISKHIVKVAHLTSNALALVNNY